MKSALEIRRGILFGLLAIVVVVLFAFDLASGSVGVGGREVWALLTGGPCDPMARDIVLKIRLIKAVVAVLAGFSLAASGDYGAWSHRQPAPQHRHHPPDSGEL